MSVTIELLVACRELIAAIDGVVKEWDGGNLAAAVNVARETAAEHRDLAGA